MENEEKTSVGDSYEIECPYCGKEMCIVGVTTDNCLETGFEDECEHCGKRWKITEVEYSATVWIKGIDDG